MVALMKMTWLLSLGARVILNESMHRLFTLLFLNSGSRISSGLCMFSAAFVVAYYHFEAKD